MRDRKSTRLNSSHVKISYAVFCLKKKKKNEKSNGRHASALAYRSQLRKRSLCPLSAFRLFFFFNDTATTEIYTLSLHDALPICRPGGAAGRWHRSRRGPGRSRR